LLDREPVVIAPGCYDCLSAKVVQKSGFKMAYLSGFGLAASALGLPDIGLATMTEVVMHAKRICSAIEIPVLCDADTGYGDVSNVWRTVKELESAGVAGIHIEDQMLPKKCGAMTGKELISAEEMGYKIQAARQAAQDADFVLLARSDARVVKGIKEAERRYERYLRAGADMVMIAEPYTIGELRYMGGAFQGRIALCAGNPKRAHNEPVESYREMGFKLVIYPMTAFLTALKTMIGTYQYIIEAKHVSEEYLAHKTVDFERAWEILDLQLWKDIKKRFNPSA